MLKFSIIFFTLLLSLSFSACTTESTQANKNATPTTKTKVSTTHPIIVLKTTKGDLGLG